MTDKLSRMYEDVFENRSCASCPPVEGLNPEGDFFSISPEVGSGYCWVYFCNEYASITIMDQIYFEDCLCEFVQPDFLCIGYYYSVSGEILTPYRRLSSGSIHAHIGTQGPYRFLHHKDIPVHSISVTLMPEYYEQYLHERYPGEYENPKDAFGNIDGIEEFPELLLVLNQIKNYQGRGMPAKLYYESKLQEVISLVLEKSKELGREGGRAKTLPRSVSREDLRALAAVAAYLDGHLATAVSLEQLARIACMSTAKLKYSFKTVYRCSIQQYIQNKRIGQAEHLLLTTELSISQIARSVGYQKPGSFSELFKRHTGLTPMEYRKSAQREALGSRAAASLRC